MGFFRQGITSVRMATLLAVLFCLFACPHGSAALPDVCAVCGPEIECQDLCDCHGHQHECVLDAAHPHQFRDDTSPVFSLALAGAGWIYAVLALDEPRHSFRCPNLMARFSSHSFAIRHLDTVILRV